MTRRCSRILVGVGLPICLLALQHCGSDTQTETSTPDASAGPDGSSSGSSGSSSGADGAVADSSSSSSGGSSGDGATSSDGSSSGADSAPPPYVFKNSWKNVSLAGAPSPRLYPAMAWTGSKVLVFGGSAGWDYLNMDTGNQDALGDGGIYDPATDTWSAMSTTGAPSARDQAAAAWTGSKVIVWGGTGASAPALGDGALYDPATNAWTAMSSAGAPSARIHFCHVWTGSKFIVWGGASTPSGAPLGDGAMYDPAANQWTPITSTGAPAARQTTYVGLGRPTPCAAWTGSKMAVWGGFSTSTAANPPVVATDGALFDPATNSWSPMSTTNAPTAVEESALVQAGPKALVFGGNTTSGAIGTGATYDPQTSAWTALPASGAPSPRIAPVAVWTGSETVIWGGLTSSGALFDGARYDPSTGAWAPVAAAPSPSQTAHTPLADGIWIGSGLFIFGGGSTAIALPTYAVIYF